MRGYGFCDKCKKNVKLYRRREDGATKFLCWACYEKMGRPHDAPDPTCSSRGAVRWKNRLCKTMGLEI